MKKLFQILTSRMFIVSALLALQIAFVAMIFLYLSWLFLPVLLVFLALNLVIVLVIINRNNNSGFKVAWIIPVLAFPVCGALFYLMFGRTHLNKKNTEKLKNALASAGSYIASDVKQLEKKSAHAAREAKYITRSAQTSVFEFTETAYLSPGQVMFEKLLYELKKAKHFIFMEYFIIEKGEMWDRIKEILMEKLNNGVEVRFMFDDLGSINKVSVDFPVELRKMGIHVAVFNPYKPSLDKFLNYRDHRKFTIIDGKVAFTGGINIADEYIGLVERFGYWEDSGLMLRGDAVNRITMMFLQIWYFTTDELPAYERYQVKFRANHDGYVIPFSDEPLIRQLVCENAYINLIDNAKEYVYICTPYLIIDEVMSAAIIRAAASGIDLRIITPHIPDKKLVFYMTQSSYSDLIEAGVKIYEFTPGFIHTKSIVSDDTTAIVGTANFDYRSFYLHFENGVWLYNTKSVMEIKHSFLRSMEQSARVTKEYIDKFPFWKKLVTSFLKVFAPLL